jgi:hypothetical protein
MMAGETARNQSRGVRDRCQSAKGVRTQRDGICTPLLAGEGGLRAAMLGMLRMQVNVELGYYALRGFCYTPLPVSLRLSQRSPEVV